MSTDTTKRELITYVRSLNDHDLLAFLRALFQSDNNTLKQHADTLIANRGGVHMTNGDATARASHPRESFVGQ